MSHISFFMGPGSPFSYYGDKKYTDYALEGYLAETETIRLTPGKLKRRHLGSLRYLQSVLRKRIETTFSQIVSLFPRKIHAVTREVFAKAYCFVISISLKQLL